MDTMKKKWSEMEWRASSAPGMHGSAGIYHVGASVDSGVSGPAIDKQILYDLISTLRAGEFLDDLYQRLEQAREVGSTTVSCQELLDFIRGGIK